MEVLKVQKGQIVAKKNDKVKEWYFIQEGSVIQKYAFVELELRMALLVFWRMTDFFVIISQRRTVHWLFFHVNRRRICRGFCQMMQRSEDIF